MFLDRVPMRSDLLGIDSREYSSLFTDVIR